MKGYVYIDGKPVTKTEYESYVNRIAKFTRIIKQKKSKILYKEFREDIQRWEEKSQFLKYFHYYKYSIWENGKTKSFYRLWRYKKKSAKLIYYTPLPPITINCEEFKRKYKSNKWMIPVNKILDCNELTP